MCENPRSHVQWNARRGFTLPAILVVSAALLILAIGILLVAGVERNTARSFVEQQRADLAARAGLEDIRATLLSETANDDYIVLQSSLSQAVTAGSDPAPQLFIARGKVSGNAYSYRYVPLFSSNSRPAASSLLSAPPVEPLLESNINNSIDLTTLPYQDKVRVAWLPVLDSQGRTVARYAYWVEDLQGKIDPAMAGNAKGAGGTHGREPYPFTSPGLNPIAESETEHPLDQIAIFSLDPTATPSNQKNLETSLLRNRPLLCSPGSVLAASDIAPPLPRDSAGHLVDPMARASEESLAADVQGYYERPVVPFVAGIHPSVAGTPRKNLNALLAKNPDVAVNEMAAFIRSALPDFDSRKGGFPEDYVKTLAANAVDYADADSTPIVKAGEYRGLDGFPLMSELALQINYEGISNVKDRKIMKFRFKLFAELCNPSNLKISGAARLSYEVSLPMDGIGSGIGGEPFDSPVLLSNPECAQHDLEFIDGRYWTRPVAVSLEPNQYRCYLFAEVSYHMDVGSSSDWIPGSTPFSLKEDRGASGASLMWEGQVVDRTWKMVRQEGLVAAAQGGGGGGFTVGSKKTLTKAILPGQIYDNYWPNMVYNMGDPRNTYYLRDAPAAENAFPENASPNRRNIRFNIYHGDAPGKPKVYARVLPSEWPDGGHNAAVGSWTMGSSDKTEITDPKFDFTYDPQMRYSAPQRISNNGRFHSATELGRIFDPIMFKPMFPSSADTHSLVDEGKLPSSQNSWPDAVSGQESRFYGGGNTLRIGRPEHPAFALDSMPGMHAARLLDLFHAGRSRAEDTGQREGPVTRVEGHLNLNTASRDALRALAAGVLVMDTQLSRQTSDSHLGAPWMAPPIMPLSLSAPHILTEADRVADAILRGRPYASPADLARAREADRTPVFGNRQVYPEQQQIEWTDAAAEEVFARVYESSTVRSRNFRIWIVAQALAPATGASGTPEVLSEVRRSFTLFANPGERRDDGSINPANPTITILHTNDF